MGHGAAQQLPVGDVGLGGASLIELYHFARVEVGDEVAVITGEAEVDSCDGSLTVGVSVVEAQVVEQVAGQQFGASVGSPGGGKATH